MYPRNPFHHKVVIHWCLHTKYRVMTKLGNRVRVLDSTDSSGKNNRAKWPEAAVLGTILILDSNMNVISICSLGQCRAGFLILLTDCESSMKGLKGGLF